MVGRIERQISGAPRWKANSSRITKPAVSERAAAGVPLVLHGGSGNSEADFKEAIAAGVAMVHINTELRVAYRDALKLSLQDNPDEVAPYKFMKPGVAAMQKVVEAKLKLYNNL
jgi:fructose-bisphosphate aldolase class II